MFEVLYVYVVWARGFVGFRVFDCCDGLVRGYLDALLWDVVNLSDDVSSVGLCFFVVLCL